MNAIEFLGQLKNFREDGMNVSDTTESKPMLYRCADFSFSARPTVDGENVLIQVWFSDPGRASMFANAFDTVVVAMSTDPSAFHDCLLNEFDGSFSNYRVNACLMGMHFCVSFLF